jgi:hypothetical protein
MNRQREHVAAACPRQGVARRFHFAGSDGQCGSYPRIARTWGLAWFYGAIPLSVIGLFVGMHSLNLSTPKVGLVGLLIVVAAAMSAGAFESVRVTASPQTIGSGGSRQTF